MPGNRHRDTIGSLTNLGSIYLKLANLDQAEIYFERALEVGKDALANDPAELILLYNSQAAYRLSLGEPETAETWLDKALELATGLPEGEIETAETLVLLGDYRLKEKLYEEAGQAYGQALETHDL